MIILGATMLEFQWGRLVVTVNRPYFWVRGCWPWVRIYWEGDA